MNQNIDSKRRPLLILAGVFAVLLIGVGIWAQSQYAQGNDPVARVLSAFVTVEDQEETKIIPQSNEEDDAQEKQDEKDQPQDAPSSDKQPSADNSSDTSSSSSSNSNSNAGGSSSGSKPDKAPVPADTISVSITIDPGATGISGGSAQLTLQPGATVYDALTSSGVSVNSQETAMGVYIVAINGLAEKDYGPTSGWTYSVNGSMPQHACNYHEVHDGDSIVWRYVNVEK